MKFLSLFLLISATSVFADSEFERALMNRAENTLILKCQGQFEFDEFINKILESGNDEVSVDVSSDTSTPKDEETQLDLYLKTARLKPRREAKEATRTLEKKCDVLAQGVVEAMALHLKLKNDLKNGNIPVEPHKDSSTPESGARKL